MRRCRCLTAKLPLAGMRLRPPLLVLAAVAACQASRLDGRPQLVAAPGLRAAAPRRASGPPAAAAWGLSAKDFGVDFILKAMYFVRT